MARVCDCAACSARAVRTLERIVVASDPSGEWRARLARIEAESVGARIVSRVGAYGFPPVPTWEEEPRELFED